MQFSRITTHKVKQQFRPLQEGLVSANKQRWGLISKYLCRGYLWCRIWLSRAEDVRSARDPDEGLAVSGEEGSRRLHHLRTWFFYHTSTIFKWNKVLAPSDLLVKSPSTHPLNLNLCNLNVYICVYIYIGIEQILFYCTSETVDEQRRWFTVTFK